MSLSPECNPQQRWLWVRVVPWTLLGEVVPWTLLGEVVPWTLLGEGGSLDTVAGFH